MPTRGRTNYPLTVSVDDTGTGFVLTAEVVAPGEPALVCGLLHTALDSLVTALEDAPGTPLRQVQVLGGDERAQVVAGWNDTAVVVPSGRGRCRSCSRRRRRGCRMRWRWRAGTCG